LKRHKPTGRPAKLTTTQPPELAKRLEEGPVRTGFASAGWRSPMLQPLIDERFGVFDHVFSSAQLLKHLGFRSQTAALVSDHLNEAKRQAWGRHTWPRRLTWAQAPQALLRLGEEASCPSWGTLSSPWARRGHQPMVKTSGQRTGDPFIAKKDILASPSQASILLRISHIRRNRHFFATFEYIPAPVSVIFVTNCQSQTRTGKLE
jgi:hypothetical protein